MSQVLNNKASLTYLQHPQLHNSIQAKASARCVQVPSVASMISKSDKSDVEMLSASLSHRTISIVPIALRRHLHLYCLPFHPCTHNKNILYEFIPFGSARPMVLPKNFGSGLTLLEFSLLFDCIRFDSGSAMSTTIYQDLRTKSVTSV